MQLFDHLKYKCSIQSNLLLFSMEVSNNILIILCLYQTRHHISNNKIAKKIALQQKVLLILIFKIFPSLNFFDYLFKWIFTILNCLFWTKLLIMQIRSVYYVSMQGYVQKFLMRQVFFFWPSQMTMTLVGYFINTNISNNKYLTQVAQPAVVDYHSEVVLLHWQFYCLVSQIYVCARARVRTCVRVTANDCNKITRI